MKAPLKWIKDYADINVDIKEYTNAMTLSGSKVEGVVDMAEGIEKVVVGKIIAVEPHPNADKLVVCKVDTGREVLQIVTGAPNIREGDIIPLALVGAKLPGGEIKAAKLRGVESYGMMCSIEELNLSRDYLPDAPENGVYVFRDNPPLGADVRDVLGLDKVIEFEITSNRPDCLSIIGLARETAATLKVPFRKREPIVKEEADGDINAIASIEIEDPELCYRYSARIVKDVKVGPSPAWMQRRLAAAGMRPINNIVDITNYVMLEYGQPMHAFDFDKLEGSKIVVRMAREGETITTLDGQVRKLDPNMLCICDAVKPVCVAGVMGGENSEVTENTRMLLLESATFNSASVRLTSKKLGLRSEASSRFEKGLDTENTIAALNRCAELIEELGAGKVVKGIIDVYPRPYQKKTLKFEPERINAFLGTDIPVEEMIRILEAIEIEVDRKNMTITPPSFRRDIEHFQDICEEIARFYDYNNIKPTLLSGKEARQGRKTYKQRMEDIIRSTMTGCGLYEAYTFSIVSPRVFDQINVPEDSPLRRPIVISNPMGEDFSILRTTTIPEMLRSLSVNNNRKIPEARLFELSHVYIPVEGQELPDEREILTLGMYGNGIDFFGLKGCVEELLDNMGIKKAEFRPETENPTFHPGRTARLFVWKNGERKDCGILGEIHPEVAKKNECPQRIYVAMLDVATLIEASSLEKQYQQLPKFPAVTRDLAIVVDDNAYVADLMAAIQEKGGQFLENVSLFDVYKGEQVPEGRKSVAFSLSFRAADRTLTDEDVNAAMDRVLRHLEKNFNAQLR